jgi:ABC-type phosphate transport system substrate-binding protein
VRKLIIAAATAATIGTLGLGATAAQASPASHSTPKVTASLTGTDVAGIASSESITLVSKATSKCTKVTVKGLPKSVTGANSSTVNKGCTVEIEGVWPATPSSVTVTITYTHSGASHTTTVKKTILPSPCENDAVGVGSDTITPLTDQLASDYNLSLGGAPSSCSKHTTGKPFEYSWDAVNPVTGQIGDSIAIKADCSPIVRPDGSSQGIASLATFTKSSSGPLCVNFARSSRARASTDPPYAAGGIAFTALAGDAVTWSVPAVNTSAPASLTTAQLQAIFTCTDTNWSQVGGANEPIAAFLPQSGSGTLSFWETELGITPGPCVSNDGGLLEENEGDNSALNNPGAIFIYSVGDWLAQTYNAPKCAKAGCTASNGVICKKVPGKDQFWCDENGTGTTQGAEKLGQINGVAPTTTGSSCPKGSPKNAGTPTCINTAFSFQRTLYNVVPFDPATTDHIPGATSPVGGLDLEGIFSASGFDCHNATAKADIAAYGFENIGNCGTTN